MTNKQLADQFARFSNQGQQEPEEASQEQEDVNVLDMYREQQKSPLKEDTHTRVTFQLDRELAKRVDRLGRNKRGFKTLFYNEAVRKMLQELE